MWALNANMAWVDGHLATTFAWKLTNGALNSVTQVADSTQIVETIEIIFERIEFDATAGGNTVTTTVNGQSPIV
jgi:prepilin-type processing-associated H-X9-DG protein